MPIAKNFKKGYNIKVKIYNPSFRVTLMIRGEFLKNGKP